MLQVGLDGFVLLVELGQVGDDVFYDVGVGEWVDLGFLLGVGWNTACPEYVSPCPIVTMHISGLNWE